MDIPVLVVFGVQHTFISVSDIDIIEILGKLKFPKIYDEKTINEVGNKIPPRN